MNNSYLLESLNTAQRKAVSAPLESQLVLAGAGSGKTKVLIHRIAWLIKNYNINPSAILAVTFTNKAANEMRQRISNLLGDDLQGIWVGTFHGIAHRLLRRHGKYANLSDNFEIIDVDDQLRIVKKIIKEMNLDDQRYIPKKILSFINSKKDSGLRASHINPGYRYDIKVKVEIYKRYSIYCQQNSVVDFSELLLRVHELFLYNKWLLEKYQEKFKYILVDEFQDTNSLQYAWLRLLSGDNNNLMAVGDDDQSIYGWRGARIDNMHSFVKDCNNITPIKLEQNYRSSSNILQAANAVIAHNEDRFNKQLTSKLAEGEKIKIYAAVDDNDEAIYIANYVKKIAAKGDKWQDIAVLYRSNAQSRLLEELLVQNSVPYRIYGGSRFFDRAEVKNVIAYLRVICFEDSNLALERIINFPPRGIGEKTVEKIRENSENTNNSMWLSLTGLLADSNTPTNIISKLEAFKELILYFREQLQQLSFTDLVKQVIIKSQIIEHYKKDNTSGITRIENLEELVNACGQFANSMTEEGVTDTKEQICEFVDHVALDNKNKTDKQQDCVQLMTMHSAKGLEFKHVFITGMEEDIFPSRPAVEENNINEERRLCYVAITRAMRYLYISYSSIRTLYGYNRNSKPSRFIKEIPEELLEHVKLTSKVSVNSKRNFKFNTKKKYKSIFKTGTKVRHPKFGDGVVAASSGSGEQEKITIKFNPSIGEKTLVLKLANLTSIY
jgi:DNA helicase-2/ATP-dependent DNA helicase PcrA